MRDHQLLLPQLRNALLHVLSLYSKFIAVVSDWERSVKSDADRTWVMDVYCSLGGKISPAIETTLRALDRIKHAAPRLTLIDRASVERALHPAACLGDLLSAPTSEVTLQRLRCLRERAELHGETPEIVIATLAAEGVRQALELVRVLDLGGARTVLLVGSKEALEGLSPSAAVTSPDEGIFWYLKTRISALASIESWLVNKRTSDPRYAVTEAALVSMLATPAIADSFRDASPAVWPELTQSMYEAIGAVRN